LLKIKNVISLSNGLKKIDTQKIDIHPTLIFPPKEKGTKLFSPPREKGTKLPQGAKGIMFLEEKKTMFPQGVSS
jgi:hypothetical protein